MNEELKKHLLDQINKSGHPTSIKASNLLVKNGWNVKNGPRYYDEDIKETREVDIFAYKPSNFIKDTTNILIVECKKQQKDKKWVFFNQYNKNFDVYTLNIAESTNGKIYDWIKINDLFKKHHYYNKTLSTYYIVSDTNPESREYQGIYKASNQVINGLLFYIPQVFEFIENNKFHLKNPMFYYPIIVLEGDLIEARVKEDGSIDLNETNHIQLLVEREYSKPGIVKLIQENKVLPVFSKKFIIDIVQLEYFEEFLKNNF